MSDKEFTELSQNEIDTLAAQEFVDELTESLEDAALSTDKGGRKHKGKGKGGGQFTRKEYDEWEEERPKISTKQHKSEEEWRSHPTIAAIGDKLNISNIDHPEVQKHLEHLSKLPPNLLSELINLGINGIYLGTGGVPELDEMQRLRGKQPRGWPEGQTWDVVGGAYSPKRKQVVAGYTEQSGSISTVLHELGHAIGDLDQLDDRSALIDHHVNLYGKLSPYLQQDEPGGADGRQELLAEGFATVVMDRDLAVARYDEEFVKWIESKMLKPYMNR